VYEQMLQLYPNERRKKNILKLHGVHMSVCDLAWDLVTEALFDFLALCS
jgi:hypothetical protein